MSNDTRQPSVDEAVAMIKRALSDDYKRLCYQGWLRDIGKEFVEEVKRRTEERK